MVMPERRDTAPPPAPRDTGICGPGRKELQEMVLWHRPPVTPQARVPERGLWETAYFLKILVS